MDVRDPTDPADLRRVLARLRAFVADNAPTLGMTPRPGARMPESVEDLELLRGVGRRALTTPATCSTAYV